MNWRTLFVLLPLLAPCRTMADPGLAPSSAASQMCRQAIGAAERAHGIPSHLLAAIARVESGRKEPASGTFNPWPWTINMDGQGSFYDNKTQAVAVAVSMRARATKSVDVGCMQISLTYHPAAFASMEAAFDPASNAEYGARFLVQLFEKTNSWPKAVALYHSATVDIGLEYQRRVYAAWPEEQRLAHLNAVPGALASAWGATVNRRMLSSPFQQNTPRIIPLATTLEGGAPPGRTLGSYRATPVRLAARVS